MSAALEKAGALAPEMFASDSTIVQISSCKKLHNAGSEALGWFCFQGGEFYQLLRTGRSVKNIVKSARQRKT